MEEPNGPCAKLGEPAHERAWELRPGEAGQEGIYILYCPFCDCEVGSRTRKKSLGRSEPRERPVQRPLPAVRAPRRRIGRAAPVETSRRCLSCGRDLPRLPPPMPPPALCAFCARNLHQRP